MRSVKLAALFLLLILLVLGALYGSMRIGWWNTDYATLRAKYAGPPSQEVTLDGAQLHFRDEGPRDDLSGDRASHRNAPRRTLVLLHGSGESLHEWDAVADLLKAKYRIVRLDWPPYGLSVDATRVYSSPRAAQLVAALVDHLALPKFVLVATSNGGNVALAYAADHQARLEGLALSVLPIAPLVPLKPPSLRVRFISWFFPTYLPNYHPRWFYRIIFAETTPPTFTLEAKDLTTVYEQNNLPGAAAHQAEYIAANSKVFKTGDAGAAAETITVPVLLQWCDLDTVIVPKTRGDEAAARFKRAAVALIHYPDIGHFPMFENPGRYAADLPTFVNGLPPEL